MGDMEKLDKRVRDTAMGKRTIMVRLRCLAFSPRDSDCYRKAKRKLLAEKDVPKTEAESILSTTCPVPDKQAIEDKLHTAAAVVQQFGGCNSALASQLTLPGGTLSTHFTGHSFF